MDTTYTKQRTITIKKKEVYWDIDFLSLYYSETAAGESPEKADRIATETARDNGTRIMRRLCDHRMGDVLDALKKFVEPVTAATADDTLPTDDWTIDMVITEEAQDSTLAPLADLIHEYVVTGALADWYAQLGINGNRESLQARADAAMKEIRELIHYRPMP